MGHHMPLVRMRRMKKVMKMQPTTSLRYLASRVDRGQDDVVVSIGGLHSGALQCGGRGVVKVPAGFPIQLLGRP